MQCISEAGFELGRIRQPPEDLHRLSRAQLADEGLVGTVPGRGRVVLAPDGPPAVLPAYRRIAADLQRAITAGELAPGDLVPSEAMLTREYEVSRSTARQALSLLASLGLVRTVHGKGRFVQAAALPDGD